MNQKGKKNKSYLVLLPAALFVIVLFLMLDSSRTQALKGSQSDSASDPVVEKALVYYYDKAGNDIDKEKVEAVRRNFGCHFEIHVYYDGEVVMRLGYSGGQVYEI